MVGFGPTQTLPNSWVFPTFRFWKVKVQLWQDLTMVWILSFLLLHRLHPTFPKLSFFIPFTLILLMLTPNTTHSPCLPPFPITQPTVTLICRLMIFLTIFLLVWILPQWNN